MITQFDFTDQYTYPSDELGITLPTVLRYGGCIYHTSAKVDTGSVVCLFKHEIGQKLELPLEVGIPITLDSLAAPSKHLAMKSRCKLVEWLSPVLSISPNTPDCVVTCLDGEDGCGNSESPSWITTT